MCVLKPVCVCVCAPAGFPVHTYAGVCRMVFRVRVRAHASLSLWRDKEERLSQSAGGLKRKSHAEGEMSV